MIRFEHIIGNIKLLKVPFGDAWTGVVLVDDSKKILIDSGALARDVDEVILPALAAEGYTLSDIDYLLNTHAHGDHIGGFSRLRELAPELTVVAAETDRKNVEEPAALAIKTRGKYPSVSPVPQSYLKGVKVDRVLTDGECLDGILMLLETPGHDDGCVCWLDLRTRTLITGDSLQGGGTPSQGIGFYKSLNLYRYSLGKLLDTDAENILCGHDYDKIGYLVSGQAAVKETLQRCMALTFFYQKCIDAELERGNRNPEKIAAKIIREHGCGMPAYLFMAVYTVCEHIRLSENNYKNFEF